MTTAFFKKAASPQDFEAGRMLFFEYAASLGIDLGFQHFEKELEEVAVQYAPPTGSLILIFENEVPIGCAGVRFLEKDIAELKRMYLSPAARGKGLGRQLLEQSAALALSLGYRKLRLDTLPGMTAAIQLYKSFGFEEIPAYRFNPVEGAIYLELALEK